MRMMQHGETAAIRPGKKEANAEIPHNIDASLVCES